jgi:peptidyl-prolyl cis-trans isomerase B (cyclophilin B)
MKNFGYCLAAFSFLLLTSCAKPLAMFTLQEEDNKAPSTIVFQNTSEKAESFMWDFGDGKTSTEESPEHKYFLSGKYTVKLIAKN